ncbi:MAG: hypothetical protein BA864_01725 [Desulfuromonadales bacterium C00003093]|nr:MAG: hypothetical protein BA864_01725 [Desulfuromonadales bacterium C00003093]
MSPLVCFYTFLIALFSSLIMVPFLRRWAFEHGRVDIPDDRKIHENPTPRLGGVAIFLSLLLSCLTFVPMTEAVRGLLIGGLIIFVTGLIDDLVGLSAKRKFVGEIIACLATIGFGQIYLTNLGNLFGFGDIILPVWLGILFTVFAVVGVINAINLIDGLDGLAGGVSMIAIGTFLVIGVLDQNVTAVLLCAALAGAILGFLKYNFYPARIFMGDVGSLTVGFMLGFLAIHLTQTSGATISPMVPVLVLGLPLLDTIKVMLRRIRKHLSPFAPDNTHVHHKFLNLGFEHRFTVLVIYGLSLFWACFAVLFRHWPEYWLLVIFLAVMFSFYELLRYVKRYRNRYAFLQRDSSAGLRQSIFYRRLADRLDRLVPVTLVLLTLFVLLAVLSIFHHSSVSWQILIGLLIAGLILVVRSSSSVQEDFLMLLVYAVGLIAAYEVWNLTDLALFGLSVRYYGDVILFLIAGFTAIKLLVYKERYLFLTTPDYLVLCICVLLIIASGKSVLDLNLGGPLLRAVVMIIALRTVISRFPHTQRYAVFGSIGLLALALVAGLTSV